MLFCCSICTDLLSSADTVYTTPCGHLFHHACLIGWLQRSKTCPECRAQCTEGSIIRIYFNLNADLDFTYNAIASLSQVVDTLTVQVREKDKTLEGLQEQVGALEGEKVALEGSLAEIEQKNNKLQSDYAQKTKKLEDKAASLSSQNEKLKAENAEQKAKLQLMTTIETLLTSSQADVDEVLKKKLTNKDLSTIVAALNKKLKASEGKVNNLSNQLSEHQKNAPKTKRSQTTSDVNFQAPPKRSRLAAKDSASQPSLKTGATSSAASNLQTKSVSTNSTTITKPRATTRSMKAAKDGPDGSSKVSESASAKSK